MNMDALYKQRRQQFWGKVLPFLRYVLSSGFLFFAGACGSVFIYYYQKLLDAFPADFPFVWVAVLVLLPFVLITPLRTYLQEADLVFLMANPIPMSPYMGMIMRRAWLLKSVLILLPWFLLWPLYRLWIDEADLSLLLFVWVYAGLLVLQLLNVWGRWIEVSLVATVQRVLLLQVRRIAMFLILFLFFARGTVEALLVLVLFVVIVLLAAVFLPRHPLPWEYLIQSEKRDRARVYRTLQLFVDVPFLQADTKRVSRVALWLGHRTKWLPFRSEWKFHHLNSKLFIRGEEAGIILRQWLVVALLMGVSSTTVVTLLFAAAGWYVTAVQLTVYARRMTDKRIWHSYAISPEEPVAAASSVSFWLYAVGAIWIGIWLLVLAWSIWSVILVFAALVLSRLYFIGVLRRKLSKEQERI
ncbi:ABC transporter permease [Marinicrinis sediminis]|uniref:ABC transporter permease n=1 Tax=Marinicrinis sediminis TaxID=1652465 RepID=A0ABW5R6H8_9BACL